MIQEEKGVSRGIVPNWARGQQNPVHKQRGQSERKRDPSFLVNKEEGKVNKGEGTETERPVHCTYFPGGKKCKDIGKCECGKEEEGEWL